MPKRGLAETLKHWECPVCLETFTKPKTLNNCSHTVCEGCLDTIKTNIDGKAGYNCPECRKFSSEASTNMDLHWDIKDFYDKCFNKKEIFYKTCSHFNYRIRHRDNCQVCYHCQKVFCGDCFSKHVQFLQLEYEMAACNVSVSIFFFRSGFSYIYVYE